MLGLPLFFAVLAPVTLPFGSPRKGRTSPETGPLGTESQPSAMRQEQPFQINYVAIPGSIKLRARFKTFEPRRLAKALATRVFHLRFGRLADFTER